MADIYNISEYILSALRREGAEGSCIVTDSSKDELTSAGPKINMRRVTSSLSVNVKAFLGSRVGSASFTGSNKDDMDAAVKKALEAAKNSPEGDERLAPGLGKLEFVTGTRPDPELLLDRTAELAEDVSREYPSAVLDILSSAAVTTNTLFASTAGTEALQKDGNYELFGMYVGKDAGGVSSMNVCIFGVNDLDTPWLDRWILRSTLADVHKQIRTVPFRGKHKARVILAPDVLQQMLGSLLNRSVCDQAIISGASPWKDKLGMKVADDPLTLSCAPLDSRMVRASRLDGNGYLLSDVNVIEGGVLKSFLLSDAGARRAGLEKAGNTGSFRILAPGSMSLAELAAGIDRGIIIGRYSGSNPDVAGNFSGVAKNSFLIENGRITDALSEVMVSGNVFEMFASGCIFGGELIANGSSVLPYASLDHVTISGK